MFDSVIFDMDGVLVDTEVFYFKRRMAFFEEIGVKPAVTGINDCLGKTEEGIWTMLVRDEAQRKELRNQYMDYRKAHPIDYPTVLQPGVKPLLQEIRHRERKLAIASSSPLKEIQKMLEECVLASYFDVIVSGAELKESKPNPMIYEKTKAALGTKRPVAVEDSVVGITAAKRAGLFTFALEQPFEVDQTQADQKIESLWEITNWLD